MNTVFRNVPSKGGYLVVESNLVIYDSSLTLLGLQQEKFVVRVAIDWFLVWFLRLMAYQLFF